jgi:hypothetical protein
VEYAPRSHLELPRVANISPEKLDSEYIRPGIPVVLTDMISDWPAMKQWTFNTLREVAGDVVVPIRGNRHHFRLLGTTSLAAYIDWLTGERPVEFLDKLRHTAPYISHNRGMTRHLGMDTDFERFTPPGYTVGPPAFWIGPPHAETPLHYDAVGIVFFAQVMGRKKAILFPKDQTPLLYESNYFDFTTCYSRVNLRDVDFERFPRFASAAPYVTELHPGDVLVFPRRLWHEFRALDNSLSVTAHAGTARDYSYRNPMLFRERARQALHWFGLYARGRCSCHSNVLDSEWVACMEVVSNAMAAPAWINTSWLAKYVVTRMARSMLHSRSLGDVLGWKEPRDG